MSPDAPNVVLLTVDSLRADHCGFMGYDGETTPEMDALAKEGVVFENAIAPGPSTPASMPVCFTGQYPVRRAAGGAERDGDAGKLASRRATIRSHMTARETLPERLGRAGYATAAFTPNPFTSRYFGFDGGFDRFEDFMGSDRRGRLYDRLFRGFLRGSSSRSLARVLWNLAQREEVFKPWEAYYDDLQGWADRAPEPYFLWAFAMDAHNPYIASQEYRSQSKLAEFHANYRFWREDHDTPFSPSVHDRLLTAYDDAVRYVDAFVGRLWRALDDDAVLVVHGDHGEAFAEHGVYGHGPTLHEENVHVPLLVVGAGERGRVETPVSLRRLPALLDAVRTGASLDGPTATTAYSRTFDGERHLLRGRSWRYLVEAEDGRFERRRNGRFEPVAASDGVADVAADRLATVREAGREAERVAEGARALGGEALL